MPKNASISLDDHFAAFVDAQIATGRHASASEVLHAGLRLLEEREARIVRHIAWLREGEVTGERSSPSTFEAEIGVSAKAEEDESRLRALREAIQEGENSGPPIPLDREAFHKSMHAEARAKARNV